VIEAYTLRVKKAKIGSQSPKTEFGAQDQYGRVIYLSFGNFIRSKKNYTFRGQKGENRLPETEFGAQKLSLRPKISMVV
jgi:hypothetical protein